jgi:starvation-inducible DNA-binding protein
VPRPLESDPPGALEAGREGSEARRQVAARSRLPELPPGVPPREELRLLTERFEVFLANARDTRDALAAQQDHATSALVHTLIEEFERHAWFLRATLAR